MLRFTVFCRDVSTAGLVDIAGVNPPPHHAPFCRPIASIIAPDWWEAQKVLRRERLNCYLFFVVPFFSKAN